MVDPSTKTTSVPPTRAARIVKVVADVESVKSRGRLSPNTSTAAEKLLNKTREPSPDIDFLEVATGLLEKAWGRKAKAMEFDELKFLFDIGYWASGIVNGPRKEEATVAHYQGRRWCLGSTAC